MNKVKQIKEKKFVRNVSILVTGTLLAQLINFILMPIITRLYGPEHFGILSTFTAITAILIPISALTYPTAIVLPKKDKIAYEIARLSTYITLFVSLSILLIILIIKNFLVIKFNLESVSMFLYAIPIVILLSGFMQICEQWLIRTQQFEINSKVHVLQSIIINGGKVVLGLFYPYALTLVSLNVMANGLRAFLMILFMKQKINLFRNFFKVNRKRFYVLLKKYKDFPIYRAPEEFISAISLSIPFLLLTTFFGSSAAGFYSIGNTVLTLPSRLVGKAVGDVYYPRITKAVHDSEPATKYFLRTTTVLFLLGIIPFGIIILFGPQIFSFIFGSEWYTAGEYARWIAIASFSTLINIPSIKSMPVLGAQKFLLFFTVIRLILRALGLLIGFLFYNNDLFAVALYSVLGGICNFIFIFITYKMYKELPYDK